MSDITNVTLLEIVDHVAIMTTGDVASNDGGNPTKTTLIKLANEAHRKICNKHKDWTFLRVTETVHGYELDDTLTTTLGANDNLSATQTSLATSGHIYIASPFTVTNVTNPYIMVCQVAKVTTGFGEFYGNMQVHICPIKDGKPDTDNPVISSNLFNPNRPSATGTAEPFYFTSADVVPTGSYYAVLDITPNIYNGVPLKWGTTTGDAKGWIKDGTGVWTACEAIYFDVYEYLGDYITTLTLPRTAQRVYQLIGGGLNLVEASNPRNGAELMTGGFRVLGYDKDGLQVEINTGTVKVLTFTAEYKSKATQLINDADIPLVPAEYCYLIEKDMLVQLSSFGWANNGKIDLQQLREDFLRGIQDLEMDYRDMVQDFAVDGDSTYVPYSELEHGFGMADKEYPSKPNNKRGI